MFLARNGFLRLGPLAVVLGAVLRVLGDETIALPLTHSSTLVRHLVPGTTTVLLAWAAQDRWRGCQVAPARRAWVLVGARAVAAAALCLAAAAVALVGQREPVLIGLCVVFTGPAVLLAQHVSLWWAVPLIAEVALLKMSPDALSADPVRQLAHPATAVTVLLLCLALAALVARAQERAWRRAGDERVA